MPPGDDHDKGLLVDLQAVQHLAKGADPDIGRVGKALGIGKRPAIIDHNRSETPSGERSRTAAGQYGRPRQ